MANSELMHYFDFDNTDLEANRNGQLSQRQRLGLERQRNQFKAATRVVGIVIAIGSLLILAVIIALGLLDHSPFLEIVIPLLFVAPLGFAAFLISGRFNVAPFAVKRLEGPVHLGVSNQPGRRGVRYRRFALQVDGHAFAVDPELSKVIQNGDRYRVYYASDWEDILSVEEL